MPVTVVWCLGAVVIAAMLNSLSVESQCTAKYCYDEEETDVMKMLLLIQQQISSLKEELCSKVEIAAIKEEISFLKENLTSCLSTKDTRAYDCADLLRQGYTVSGVYTVNPRGSTDAMQVYCDMVTDDGGWLVFQRRQDGSVDFYRDWYGYKRGFGSSSGEFWLGNDKLHELTSQKNYTLRIELEDWENERRYAEYPMFHVGPENEDYLLTLGPYNGTAGDALKRHGDQRFSTKDRDNDKNDVTHCPRTCHAGWWYHFCYDSNLNGLYKRPGDYSGYQGIQWNAWRHQNKYYFFKKVEMKFRPTILPDQ